MRELQNNWNSFESVFQHLMVPQNPTVSTDRGFQNSNGQELEPKVEPFDESEGEYSSEFDSEESEAEEQKSPKIEPKVEPDIEPDVKKEPKVEFKCDECPYAAPAKYKLKQHKKRKHIKSRDNKCKLCDFTTTDRDYLRTHMKKHEKTCTKRYQCNICDKKFRHPIDLRNRAYQ